MTLTLFSDYHIFPTAICNGKISSWGAACNKIYTDDQIKYKLDGQVVRESGGTCVAPEKCAGCEDGFYSGGNECLSKCTY